MTKITRRSPSVKAIRRAWRAADASGTVPAARYRLSDDGHFRPVDRPSPEELRQAGAAADDVVLTDPTPAPVALSWLPGPERSVREIQRRKHCPATTWPAWTDRDVWELGPDPAALNAENDAVAADEVAAQAEAEAVRYDRDRAEADLDAWLDAIEADRDSQDRYERGIALC